MISLTVRKRPLAANIKVRSTAETFGSMPFLQWLDARFVASRSPWLTLVKEQPDVCRAVLRLHHVGMIGLPSGARMQEEHRSAPTAVLTLGNAPDARVDRKAPRVRNPLESQTPRL